MPKIKIDKLNDLLTMSDSQKLNVDGVIITVVNAQAHSLLNAFCALYASDDLDVTITSDLVVEAKQNGLSCTWLSAPNVPLHFYIDIDKFVKQQFSYPAPKQGAFNQALGKKTKNILDATGGWAGDTFLMCAQGYTVTLLERNPIMALLLDDAMSRLALTDWIQENQITPPKIINVDAIDFLSSDDVFFDCVYIDPMFPPKRKKSAAVNKNIQFLQWLVGEDLDANKLAEKAFAGKCSRLVVKRPDYAQPLLDGISVQFSSKLVHYDVYLKY